MRKKTINMTTEKMAKIYIGGGQPSFYSDVNNTI